MSVFSYAVGAASIAVGALSAAWYLLSLTIGPAWFRRLRRIIHVGLVTKRGPRRTFLWRGFGFGLGLVANGTLVVLGVHDETLGVLSIVVGSALLIFLLVPMFMQLARRRSGPVSR